MKPDPATDPTSPTAPEHHPPRPFAGGYHLAALLTVAYVNSLPFLCRLPSEADWVLMHWPSSRSAQILTIAVNSIPAIPLLLTVYLSRSSKLPLAACFVATSWTLVHFHRPFGSHPDAQDAIALLFIPVYAAIAGVGATALGSIVHLLVPRNRARLRAYLRN